MQIGVLALQGGFDAHIRRFQELGVKAYQIKTASALCEVDALVLPGGESGALLRLMAPWDGLMHLRAFACQGKPILGTCAGLILLAKAVSPRQDSLGLLDVTVERNAYGRQIDSFIGAGSFQLGNTMQELECVFIRAPRIIQVGQGVNVLAHCQGNPVMVQQGMILAASFHPELSGSLSVHQYFTQMVKERQLVGT